MKTIALQVQPGGTLQPFSKEDADKLASFKPNQVLQAKLSGIQKPRSYEQLKLYFALCRLVADNSDDPNWDTSDKVSLQIKFALGYFDTEKTIVVDGKYSHTPLRSVSYEALPHMEAVHIRYFDRAFEVMAGRLGVSVDEMIKQVEGG